VQILRSCLKDKDKDRSGPEKPGARRTGMLSKFGYHDVTATSVKYRRVALRQAICQHGRLFIYQKLNSVYLLNRGSNPTRAKIFLADRDWVGAH
jgi:hypothetical protein